MDAQNENREMLSLCFRRLRSSRINDDKLTVLLAERKVRKAS